MSLLEYLHVIRKRWVLMASIIVVACTTAGYAGSALIRPAYQATSQLIASTIDPQGADAAPGQADLTASLMLINTYKELIKSPPILQQVVKRHPELRLTAADLRAKLKIVASAGSQIMSLTFEDESYERASAIVNTAAGVFVREAPAIMNARNVRILSEADPAAKPAPRQPGVLLAVLTAFAASFVVSAALAFLLESFDDRLQAPEAIEQSLGLTVITAIPAIRKSDLKALKQPGAYKRIGEEVHVHVNG